MTAEEVVVSSKILDFLQVEPPRFADGLDVETEIKRRV